MGLERYQFKLKITTGVMSVGWVVKAGGQDVNTWLGACWPWHHVKETQISARVQIAQKRIEGAVWNTPYEAGESFA